MNISKKNINDAKVAKDLYISTTDPTAEADDWDASIASTRAKAIEALLASNDLHDIEGALTASGSHMIVFRHLLAPPKSQDQFKLLCPSWSKGTEKSGRPLKLNTARNAANTVKIWLDKSITPWLSQGRQPTTTERDLVIERIVSFIAPKEVDTAKRNRLSSIQEHDVVQLLLGNGWTRLPPALITASGQIPPKHFIQKTLFATGTTAPHEVDIACGLKGSFVTAMECKVTNDTTNSIKRVNDVLKKHEAWKSHWGNFVETAALLQGVIRPKDVQRLTDKGVHVFWSHDLNTFSKWIQSRV